MFPASCAEETFRIIEAQESVADFLVISSEDLVKLSQIPGFQVQNEEENCRTSPTCQNNQQALLQSIQQPVAQPPKTFAQPHQPCNQEQAVVTAQPSILLNRSKSVPNLSCITKSLNHFQYNNKTAWTHSTYTKSYSRAPSEYLNIQSCTFIVNRHTSIKPMNENNANNYNSKSKCDSLSSKRKRKLEYSENSSASIHKNSKIVDQGLKNCKQSSSDLFAGGNGSTYTMSLMNSRPLNNKQDVNIPQIQINEQTSPINHSTDLQLGVSNAGILNFKTDFAIPNHRNAVRSIGTDCVGLLDNQPSDDARSANNAKTLHITNDSPVSKSVDCTFRTLLCNENIDAVMDCIEISNPSMNGTYVIKKDREMAENVSQDQQGETVPFSYVIGNDTQQACLGITGNEFVSSFTLETESQKSTEKDWIASSGELFALEKNPEVGEEQAVMRVKRRLKFSEEKPAIDNFKVVMPLSPAPSRFSPEIEIENIQERIGHISPLMLNAANAFGSQSRIISPSKSLFDFTSDDVKQMFDCVWDIYS